MQDTPKSSVQYTKVKQDMSKQNATSGGYVPASSVSTMSKHSKKRHKKAALITIGVIVGVLALVYAIGVFYFSSHFFPNTAFGTHDISFESDGDFASEIESRVQDYTLEIEGQGFSCTLDSKQASLNIDQGQVAKDACLNQHVWTWPIEMFSTHDVSDIIEASFDKENAHSILSAKIKAFNETATPSKDAAIVYQEAAGACIVEPEVYGKQINEEVLLTKVDKCLKGLVATCEVTEDELIKPTIVSSDSRILAALDKANKMAGGDIALTLNGSVSAGKITKAMIADWIILSKDVEAVLNEEAIQAWATQEGEEFNTYQTTRSWTRADGKSCSAGGGTFGWIVNADSLAESIINQINNQNFSTIDIPCDQTADVYKGPGKRDWGAYVDVDLTEQVVRYYDANDQLVYSCHCISGSPSGGHATPTGVYCLNSNDGESTLIGERGADGTPEYETKVAYWMPFIGNSIGLHDASWQPWGSWSASSYSSGLGSHGCINLSTDDAAWFHSNLSVGVCVITHD